MTLEDKVHAQRLRLFRRAAELGNVSAACREAGVSRSLYYGLKGRLQRYGPDCAFRSIVNTWIGDREHLSGNGVCALDRPS